MLKICQTQIYMHKSLNTCPHKWCSIHHFALPHPNHKKLIYTLQANMFLLQPTNAQLYITTVSLYTIYIPTCHPHRVLHLCLAKLHKFLILKLLKLQFHKIIKIY